MRQSRGKTVELGDPDISLESNVGALSGGNQQKVLIARALLAEVSLLLAEEPTAGVDMGSRAEIYRILREVATRARRSSSCLPTVWSCKACVTVFSFFRAGTSSANWLEAMSPRKRSAA